MNSYFEIDLYGIATDELLKKLNALDSVLAELRSLGQVSNAQLDDDWRTRRALERDLQVLIEIMIDHPLTKGAEDSL